LDSSDIWQLLSLLILLLLSSFFSASETALMSLSKIRIRQMLEEKIEGAETISKLVDNPSKLLSTILVGNNIVNISASALATSLAIRYLGATGVGFATGIMTLLILIFGEITPKALAAEYSEQVSLRVAKIIAVLTKVFSPVITILMLLTNLILRIFGKKINQEQPFITEEELKTMVHVGHEEGVLEGEEKQMIYNVFEFGDSQAQDVMIPRTEMVAIEVNSTYEEIINLFKSEQFSRIPVYQDTIDNIIGILSIKDLFLHNACKENFDIRKYLRKPFFTYEFKRTAEIFKEMRSNRTPMAIVLDEYGGTAGIMTIEDLVEEIVGDIEDEYDDNQEKEINVIKENEYIVEGSAKIDLVNELIGINIQTEDFDSIGGFVLGQFGRLPKKGESIKYKNIKFIIENIERNRIEKIRILT